MSLVSYLVNPAMSVWAPIGSVVAGRRLPERPDASGGPGRDRHDGWSRRERRIRRRVEVAPPANSAQASLLHVGMVRRERDRAPVVVVVGVVLGVP